MLTDTATAHLTDDEWTDRAVRQADEPLAKQARQAVATPWPASAVGTRVRLQNIVDNKSLNEELGTIEDFDNKSQRYAVRVHSTGERAQVQERCMRVSVFGNTTAG